MKESKDYFGRLFHDSAISRPKNAANFWATISQNSKESPFFSAMRISAGDFFVIHPGEYIISLRVAKAKALLSRRGRRKLDEVATQTGFCDASHLSRTLRAYKPKKAINLTKQV